MWTEHPAGVRARNARTNQIIADRVGIAASRRRRAVGLIGRSGLQDGEALWIAPSCGVHTCGMRFSIDVLALDAAGRVVDLAADLKPWRLRLPRRWRSSALELPAGTIGRTGTQIGDEVVFEVADDVRSC
jgi:uncharacterized membrane protein (UPF0127 family)